MLKALWQSGYFAMVGLVITAGIAIAVALIFIHP